MDRKTLAGYRVRKIRIGKLLDDIKALESMDIEVVAGKVQTSMADFPYIPCRTSVLMDDPVEKDKIDKRIQRKQEELYKLRSINDKVDEFIELIDDPGARSLFEYYYIDGLEKVTQKEIADKVGINEKNISITISKYAED